jgi:DNA-binding NarL/FixJ family response regulator
VLEQTLATSALLLVGDPARGRKITAALAASGVTVLAEARDSGSALPLIAERGPTLLIIELAPTTSDQSGLARNELVLELVQDVRQSLPELKVIAVMECVEPGLVAKAAARGVDAYVLQPL